MSVSDFAVVDLRTGEIQVVRKGEIFGRAGEGEPCRRAAEMVAGKPMRRCPAGRAQYKVGFYAGMGTYICYEPDDP